MKRRRFLAALGVAAIDAPIAAQQSTGIPRIGVLMGSSPSVEAEGLAAFRGALEKLGYIDGQNILIELRYAMGQPDRLEGMAHELVALAPAVIVCVGRQAPCRRPHALSRLSSGRSTIPSNKGLSRRWPDRAAIRPGSPRCLLNSIRNAWSCCTR